MTKAITKKAPPFVGFAAGMTLGLVLSLSLGVSLKKSSMRDMASKPALQVQSLKEFERSSGSIQWIGAWPTHPEALDPSSSEAFALSGSTVAIRLSNWSVAYSSNPVIYSVYEAKLNRLQLQSRLNSIQSLVR